MATLAATPFADGAFVLVALEPPRPPRAVLDALPPAPTLEAETVELADGTPRAVRVPLGAHATLAGVAGVVAALEALGEVTVSVGLPAPAGANIP